jgi:ABC-type phosphate transport system auxiliary subunit
MLIILETGQKTMSATHVMLTSEQFGQLATKEDLKSFATKEDLKSFAKKDDLKSFLTKDDLKVINQRFDGIDKKFKDLDDKLDLRFNQLDYKLETSFDDLNVRLEGLGKNLNKHERDINELNLFTVDHAMRIKKLEFRTF